METATFTETSEELEETTQLEPERRSYR